MQKLDFNTDTFDRGHVAEMEKFNKFPKERVAEHYDSVAANYDGIYLRAGYPDPEKCAEFVEAYTEHGGLSKGDVEVLDLGCGTGLVG